MTTPTYTPTPSTHPHPHPIIEISGVCFRPTGSLLRPCPLPRRCPVLVLVDRLRAAPPAPPPVMVRAASSAVRAECRPAGERDSGCDGAAAPAPAPRAMCFLAAVKNPAAVSLVLSEEVVLEDLLRAAPRAPRPPPVMDRADSSAIRDADCRAAGERDSGCAGVAVAPKAARRAG